MNILFLQLPLEVHPLQATPLWCLIAAAAAASNARDRSRARNAVFSAFKAASLQGTQEVQG